MLISPRDRYILAVTLGYAIFASGWIFASDQLMTLLVDPSAVILLSNTKGIFFVMITASLLFVALGAVPPLRSPTARLDRMVAATATNRRRLLAYLFALVATSMALAIRMEIAPVVSNRPMLILFIAPIAASAFLGGLGPGLLSTLLATLVIDLLGMPPFGSFWIENPADRAQLALLAGNGILISLLSETMHRLRHQVELRRRLHAVTLASIGDAVITTDTSGQVTYLNPVAEQLTGWPLQDAVGHSLLTVFSVVNEQTGQPASDPVGRVLATGRVVGLANHTELIARDGRHLPIEDTAAPICFPHEGAIAGVVLVFHDCTEQRKAEAELRKSEEKFRLAIEASRAGIWDWDIASDALVLSERCHELFAIPRERPVTLEMFVDLLHPEDRPRVEQALTRARHEGADYDESYRIRLPDGGLRWISAKGRGIRDADGRIRHMAGILTDITASKQTEEELLMAARVFHWAAEGIVVTDDRQRIIRVNDAFCAITGYSQDDVLGRMPHLLASGRHDALFFEEMWKELNARGWWKGEIWNRRKDGEVYPEWLTISVVRDAQGNVINYVGIFSDITEMKTSQQRIEFLATHDELTDLPNRFLLLDRLHQAIARATRHRSSFALLFVDLDNFKVVNDSLGHATGDQLLKEVADRLRDCVRTADTVARFGGDEFTLLIEDATQTEAQMTAARVGRSLSQTMLIGGQELQASASIGICLYPEDGEDPETLLKNADSAMYHAKEQGKNTYHFFTHELHQAADERLRLEAWLRRAIENDELELHYQPQIDLVSGRLVGLEALVRWQHPVHGMIPPGRFIPVAEKSALIENLGEWVMNAACAQMVAWQEEGVTFPRISINASAEQFRRGQILDMTRRLLDHHRLAPKHLVIELTESALMTNIDQVERILDELKKIGIRISIDDFGTGFSSLSYLRRYPIDELKIDRSFIDDVAHNQDDRAITQTIIAMSRTLGMTVVAEGIETDEQLAVLRDLDCPVGQGYLFDKPLPADEFVSRYKGMEQTMKTAE